jgi:hypothetical protein
MVYAIMATRKKDPEQAKDQQEETQNVVIPLPKGLHRELRFLSVDRDRPMNALILEAINNWWARQPEFGKYPLEAGDEKKGQRRR